MCLLLLTDVSFETQGENVNGVGGILSFNTTKIEVLV